MSIYYFKCYALFKIYVFGFGAIFHFKSFKKNMVKHFLVHISCILQQIKISDDTVSILIIEDCSNILKQVAELEEISEICFSTK